MGLPYILDQHKKYIIYFYLVEIFMRKMWALIFYWFWKNQSKEQLALLGQPQNQPLCSQKVYSLLLSSWDIHEKKCGLEFFTDFEKINLKNHHKVSLCKCEKFYFQKLFWIIFCRALHRIESRCRISGICSRSSLAGREFHRPVSERKNIVIENKQSSHSVCGRHLLFFMQSKGHVLRKNMSYTIWVWVFY